MRKWRVLLADDNKQFVGLLAEALGLEKDFEVVCMAYDGEEAIAGIEEYKPDLVVLDIIMPKLDGIAVQEKLQELPNRPKIVIFSALGKDYITRQTLKLGADGYFMKPFDTGILIKRLRRLMGETNEEQATRERQLTEEDLNRRISAIMHKLAVPPHLLGYKYLIYAIKSVACQRKMLENITYKLYPEIAQQFSSTPSRVERAMRNAIESTWDRCRVETMEEMFGYSVNANRDKPSNSGFIALVADKVMLDCKKQ